MYFKKNSIISLLVLTFVIATFTTSVYAETQVSGTISTDTTWTIDQSPYIVTSSVYVQHSSTGTALLTIEAGVEVRFEQTASLYIGWDRRGALYAKGTEDKPIIFTGNTSHVYEGSWGGIHFTSRTITQLTHMENCHIEYGGYGLAANIVCDIANVPIVNCSIKKSSGYPIKVLANGLKISNLTFTDNKIQATLLSGSISEDTTWTNRGDEGTYAVTASIYVQHGGSDVATLTIEPGAKILFDLNTGLYIGWDRQGALNAKGTESKPIIFRSSANEPYPGSWKGIQFTDRTIDTLSIMQYCVVEYAGYASNSSLVITNAKPTIANNIIRSSFYNGIYISGSGSNGVLIKCNNILNNKTGIRIGSSEPAISNNNIYNNSEYAIYNESTTINIDATENWWGEQYPSETNKISDHVIYEPMLQTMSNCIVYIDPDPSCELNDSDNDGVDDSLDKCPNTIQGSAVYSNGCLAQDLYDEKLELTQQINQLNEQIQNMYTKTQMENMVQDILEWGDCNNDGKITLQEIVEKLMIISGIITKK